MLSETQLVRACIEKVQKHQDQEAFNLLLDKFFKNSCKYATTFLNNRIYSNLINWYLDEVESFVFLAFWKAVNNYDLESTTGVLSFKNYLYQLIRFETLNEIKNTFNWQCIPKIEKKWYLEHNKKRIKNSLDICIDLEIKQKSEEISQFLETKNRLYSAIWKLKANELSNQEICEQIGISKAELKGRWQYIKRLVLEKYSCNDLSL
ncbi:sigma-70 family RNA polymerase sigma factor [Mycoplasma wenyonii]|uniref:Sigma-70 family RNA polymerase sigma factor n=1 Tax=Mycoplasma wenyonii TaxID=65123 RepID=A0A328PUB0_9MOLU|nr:sigma-70 family RNA polymerase sigma factor [Mycoplasma wenyonii]RAO95360.1 sigma-70 family RNA polymerase sigma factor [Mycoplasma wenyonii]